MIDCRTEIDKLQNEIHLANDNINSLRIQLDEQKVLVSNITATKERENTDLNKFLNDTIMSHNKTMIEREKDHKDIVNS